MPTADAWPSPHARHGPPGRRQLELPLDYRPCLRLARTQVDEFILAIITALDDGLSVDIVLDGLKAQSTLTRNALRRAADRRGAAKSRPDPLPDLL